MFLQIPPPFWDSHSEQRGGSGLVDEMQRLWYVRSLVVSIHSTEGPEGSTFFYIKDKAGIHL